ncbi:NADP-dependent malic enzyme-like [Nicotiana tabacum]|uniref:NADP-dependent malic enzyme-like n=1 Tax=Nicotiana tabacum TaxID=4097 RepID=A0AC58RVZ4_TOBAC
MAFGCEGVGSRAAMVVCLRKLEEKEENQKFFFDNGYRRDSTIGHLPANDMLLAASEALAAQVTEEHFAKGMIYPPFGNIRKISAYIAASTVAAKAYELGVATRISRHADLVTYADESCMYTPNYRSYR